MFQYTYWCCDQDSKCNETYTQWFFLAIYMEHRLNTQHSVAKFIVDFSVVLQECSDRPNSGQLIYHNMKGFLCSIDTQNSMDS